MVSRHEKTSVRQRQILDAARKVIIKYGSEHITIKRIAEEVGVSEGAIYRHFKSKRDIVSLMIHNVERSLLADFKSLQSDGHLTLETLERVAVKQMTGAAQGKGVSFQVIDEIVSFGDKQLNQKVYDVIESYTRRVEGLLSEGVKAGVIRPDIDLRAAALLFYDLMQGLVNNWTLSQRSFNLEEEYESRWKLFREAVIKH